MLLGLLSQFCVVVNVFSSISRSDLEFPTQTAAASTAPYYENEGTDVKIEDVENLISAAYRGCNLSGLSKQVIDEVVDYYRGKVDNLLSANLADRDAILNHAESQFETIFSRLAR